MTKDTKEVVGKIPPKTVTVKQQKDAPMLKVVIRCLPPTLTEEEFLKLVEPLTGHDFFNFFNADSSLGQYACSRAYINFLKQSDVVNFRDKWDGFPFKDTNGKEYPAVVELAPYQKIPKRSNRKPDPRCGTIEEDEDYQKFLEVLNAEIEPLPSAEAYLEELEAKQRAAATTKVTTPLIDFLKKKRVERIKARDKAREERRQKEKERKRQREEEKRRQEKERRKKKEERERRDKDIKQKKEEAVKSDGEKKTREREKIVKEDDRRRSREVEKRDSQIKLLKKLTRIIKLILTTEAEIQGEEEGTLIKLEKNYRGRGGRGGSEGREGRREGKGREVRRKPENVRQQESSSRDKDQSSGGRDRNAYSKSINDKRKPPGREGKDKDWDRYRDRGGGRDRYGDRERDRRQPSKTSSQESLQRAGKPRSDGNDERQRDRDERKGDKRDERSVGRGTREAKEMLRMQEGRQL
ncbi:putative regulator of nonsense transcripts 3A-like [Apostichopus japonicus]|uniref:Putative regulator of nonsense transcripts 3A-like n=1 Tax=Stichopus japonicus TaxID=307972 RepID=A0A2G8KC34_STIJA|nr:putative regulator of nonsense transcripts 3A-like [Apostichopus japonicus]